MLWREAEGPSSEFSSARRILRAKFMPLGTMEALKVTFQLMCCEHGVSYPYAFFGITLLRVFDAGFVYSSLVVVS